MVKKNGYFQHHCDLPESSENSFLLFPPYLGTTQKWLRSLGQCIYLNENSKRTKDFFRSYAAVKAEKRRQAFRYPTTIHPFSTFAIYRERILCVMWLICYVTDPANWSLSVFAHYLFFVQMILDILFFINAFVTCVIGYVVPLTKEIVLSPREIFKNRIWSYFIPESVACIPFSLILRRFFHVNEKQSRWMALSCIKIIRLLRLCDFFEYLNNIFNELNIPDSIYTWVVVLLINMYQIFWAACFLCFVIVFYYAYDGLPKNSILKNRPPKLGGDKFGTNIIEPEDNFSDCFITLVTIACCHYFGASSGYVPVELNLEKFLCSLVMLFGYLVCNFGVAKILGIFVASNHSGIKYEAWTTQVAQYTHFKKLPQDLKKRLKIYNDYKYQKRYFNEHLILSTLSAHLRNEVILYGCRNVLEKVPLFQGMSKGVVGSIVTYMKREIYLPNDVVLKYGEPLTKMFWVSFGTLAAHYGPDGTEILHFEDGDHFGDLSITKKGGRAKLTVVSLEISEIFTLSRKDVKHCTTFLEQMSERIVKIAREEKSSLYPSLAKMNANEGVHNAVVADLRRGRILETDNWRTGP